MKNFLVCQKCDSQKLKIVAIKHREDRVGVKIGCECGETDVFSVPADSFMSWVATPEISAVMKIFNGNIKKKSEQKSLW